MTVRLTPGPAPLRQAPRVLPKPASAEGARRLLQPQRVDAGVTAAARIESLVAQLTAEEKVALVSGTGFATRAIPRLGIPSLRMVDGPLGVRHMPATAFPAGIALGATFDPRLTREVAAAIAREARAQDKDVLLAPTVNIVRTPLGGRNFESFSEDPALASAMAEAYVMGVESQGVMSTTKHVGLNEQEVERMTLDVRASPRALQELYFPPFAAAIRAGTSFLMAAYPRFHGSYATESAPLLQGEMKGRFGFANAIMSDWDATHSTVAAANNGLDLEMPGGKYFGEALATAVAEGRVPMAVLDDKVRRLLRAMDRHGHLCGGRKPAPAIDLDAHFALARRAAAESTVLLKNDGAILPLSPRALRRIALIGPNAATARPGAGGSSQVIPHRTVSPLAALRARLEPAGVDVTHAVGVRLPRDIEPVPPEMLSHERDGVRAPGLLGEYFANRELAGAPVLTRVDAGIDIDVHARPVHPAVPRNDASIRWSGYLTARKSGAHVLTTRSDDGVRVRFDGALVIDDWTEQAATYSTATVHLEAGQSYPFTLEYFQAKDGSHIQLGLREPEPTLFADAARAAAQADVAIVFAGYGADLEGEGVDRVDTKLPAGQDELIAAVLAANPRTVVVTTGSSSFDVEGFVERVPALLHTWYPGQEAGHAIADILLGDVNPSAKLPVTWVKRREDATDFGHYPGRDGRLDYGEDIFVGYRGLGDGKPSPRFHFGHGLSYTRFTHGEPRLRVDEARVRSPRVQVTTEVANTGERPGAEVVQLYVTALDARAPMPPRALKAFRKVRLGPGERKRVSFTLDASAFRRFDPERDRFVVDPGRYTITTGGSSAPESRRRSAQVVLR